MIDRRNLVLGTAALAVAVPRRTDSKPARRLQILLLGGTGFLGPHQVDYALGRGHAVTLFNRGASAAGRYGNRVEILRGDRDTRVGDGLKALADARRWDVVIDNSGYLPRHVRDSATLLRDRVGHYVFVSTAAVYDLGRGETFDEGGPLRTLADPASEVQDGDTYGPLKVECERVVRDLYAGRCTIVRPTHVYGPGDDTDRFTYWIERLARGGDVLGPPDPGLEMQWVDARDLCPWIVQLAERGVPGTFNVAGPTIATNWGTVLARLAALGDARAKIHWSTPEVLEDAGITLPLVQLRPRRRHLVSDAAQRAGLAYRTLDQTVAATRRWWATLPEARRAAPRGWPSPDLERRAIEALRRAG